MEETLDKKYKKVPNNENAIEIDGKVVLSFDLRYKEYLKWKDENPDLEQQLIEELEQEIENKRLYNNGAPHIKGNIFRWYRENGQKYIVAEMEKDGQLPGGTDYNHYHGKVIQYREDGKIKSKENYSHGFQTGSCEYYHENGKLRQSGYIKNYVKEGEIKSYLENGNLILIEKFKNGKKHGRAKSYHQWSHRNTPRNNKIETYKDDKLYGEWIDYHLNNKERAKGNMLYGMMDGKWTFWYHNGNKELECEFDFGNPVGTAKIYHDNGTVKEVVEF